MSVDFANTPSNVAHISQKISTRDIFPDEDVRIVSTVDSADFARQGISVDQVLRAAFGLNKEISVKDNHQAMGLVANKLVLAYKNKPDFLSNLVMKAKPSLISIYNTVRRLAKEAGYDPPEAIEKGQKQYNLQQMRNKQPSQSRELKTGTTAMGEPSQELVDRAAEGDLKQIKQLKNGQSILVDNVVAQYGGGVMGMNRGKQYDRYTVFKNNPEADFLVIG